MQAEPPGPIIRPAVRMENSGGRMRIVIDSTPLAVREALKILFAAPPLIALSEASRGTAEIVLAEALNNVVEHAYAHTPGKVELTLITAAAGLYCQIEDQGVAMPGMRLPEGAARDIKQQDELPEGGFGWYLIRILSYDLEYRRIGGRNQLRFRLDTKQSAN